MPDDRFFEAAVDKLCEKHVHLGPVYARGGITRQWIDAGGTMRVEEVTPQDFYRPPPDDVGERDGSGN